MQTLIEKVFIVRRAGWALSWHNNKTIIKVESFDPISVSWDEPFIHMAPMEKSNELKKNCG